MLVVFAGVQIPATAPAQTRAKRLGLGMNFSYLENWWLGTKEKSYADFMKPAEAEKKLGVFKSISQAGFKTVRIPINFGAWASYEQPYRWTTPEGLRIADRFIDAALAEGLFVVIDLHHVEFDKTIKGSDATERLAWMWKEIAQRYRHLDPEKAFFELRNEPHDIKAEEWRAQAEVLIKTVRQTAPQHTMMVGFHDWNSRQAMLDSRPFADKNIIYTFHYYDPFIFTHQGATWSSAGLPELRGLPFPSNKKKIEIPKTAKGTWIEERIKNYSEDSKASKMFDDLKAAKDWAGKNDVPIFLGEFGSFGNFAAMEDRCRHAEVLYLALGRLDIPNAWWEWDGGFAMFDKGTTTISNCMHAAVKKYSDGKAKK
ncbi:MAG: glycoside hydrolase family 5 protein [bacterium]|nr:glycoside hydrolase family 5 protein [bacterium]